MLISSARPFELGLQNFSKAAMVKNIHLDKFHCTSLLTKNRAVRGFHLGPDDEETNGHIHPSKGHGANGHSGKLPGKVLKRVSLFNLH